MEKASKSLRKMIHTLAAAKGRRAEGAFVTERTKNVLELLGGPFELRYLVATAKWFDAHNDIRERYADKCLWVDASEMERMTTLATPSDVLAVFELPANETRIDLKADELYIALDAVQDPGNLGTIIRIADWFGIDTILAGAETADAFNPKTIISSMGSIARVVVRQCDLEDVLTRAVAANIPVWGTFLEGENIYTMNPCPSPSGIIVMGNEGKGISPAIEKLVTNKISIPAFPPGVTRAESLNVAIATAIVVAEFRRFETLNKNI